MTEQNNLPAKNNGSVKELTAKDRFKINLDKMRSTFESMLPDDLPYERFKSAAIYAINNDEKVLTASSTSLFNALVKCASDGLVPDGRDAVITVYNTKDGPKAQYNPMYGGLLKRARNTGQIADIHTDVVFANDYFEWTKGFEETVDHRPAALLSEPGEPIGAYAVAKLVSGEKRLEVMRKAQIMDVKKVAKQGSAWYGPFETEMWRKTVLRRLIKTLPVSSFKDAELLQRLIQHDNETYALESQAEPQQQLPAEPKREIGQSRTIQRITAEAKKPAPKPAPESEPEPEEEEAAPGIQESDDQAPAPQQDEGEPPLNLSLDTADFKSRGKVDWMKWSKAFDKLLAEVQDDAIDMLLSANEKRLETLSIVDDNAMEVVTKALQARGVSLGVELTGGS